MGDVLADHATRVSGSGAILRARGGSRKLLSGDEDGLSSKDTAGLEATSAAYRSLTVYASGTPISQGGDSAMSLFFREFVLAFSALLPVVNPIGSALIFLSVVGSVPADYYAKLSRQVAVNTILFLLIIELIGAALLTFFAISLPVVQLAGGLVLASMGWQFLNSNQDSNTEKQTSVAGGGEVALADKVFYPLTFPVTAGPGCVVVTVTLGAHASQPKILANVVGHLGIAAAIVVLGLSVWLCYAYAPVITLKIRPQTAHGILRVIAFVLLCIGVQIAKNGLSAMIVGSPR
jgi:multiple antibiotic resistance protein